MNNQNQNEVMGSFKISPNVIAAIAKEAASEVDGVSSIVDETKIKDVFNIKKSLPRQIKVNINNDTTLVDVYLNIKHGAKIQSVCQEVQQKVKDAIQSMTGIAVSKVNIHIVGIDFVEENLETTNLEK